MKIRSNTTFSIEDLSQQDVEILFNIFKFKSQNLTKEQLDLVAHLTKILEEQLIEVGALCEGCEQPQSLRLSKVLCPISQEKVSICMNCLEARKKYVSR